MYFTTVLTASLAPLAVLAASFEANMESDLAIRQEAPVKPTPCVRDNSVTAEETKARSEIFAKAFMYDKDISKAWSFVVSDYINHNPQAQNGSDSAWNILSPVWANTSVTPLRQKWISPQSFLNYIESGEEIVDRFRWEGGCIAEHWDAGESWPKASKTDETVGSYEAKKPNEDKDEDEEDKEDKTYGGSCH